MKSICIINMRRSHNSQGIGFLTRTSIKGKNDDSVQLVILHLWGLMLGIISRIIVFYIFSLPHLYKWNFYYAVDIHLFLSKWNLLHAICHHPQQSTYSPPPRSCHPCPLLSLLGCEKNGIIIWGHGNLLL